MGNLLEVDLFVVITVGISSSLGDGGDGLGWWGWGIPSALSFDMVGMKAVEIVPEFLLLKNLHLIWDQMLRSRMTCGNSSKSLSVGGVIGK